MPIQIDFNRKQTNLDRFRPNGHRPVTPLFYDTTYDSEAPTIHMNGSKCRLSALGAGFLCRDFICHFNLYPFSTLPTRFRHNWPIYDLRNSFRSLTTIYIAHFDPFSIDITYFEPKRPVFDITDPFSTCFRYPTTQPISKTNVYFPL